MVQKAVIPAAGWGKRFLPLTKCIPKELFPLADKPLIQYIVEEALKAGIKQLIIISSSRKPTLNYFFHPPKKLLETLKDKKEHELLAQVSFPADRLAIQYISQETPLGLGHAVLMAKEAVGDEPFAVLLPDELFEAPLLKRLLYFYKKLKKSIIGVQEVPLHQVNRYGIIRPKKIAPRLYEIEDIVEKPEPGEAFSQLASIGRYVLSPHIFSILEKTPPGKDGEIQLTDALRLLLKEETFYAYEYKGVRYDAGDLQSWLFSLTLKSLHHPTIGPAYRQFLRRLKI